MDPHSGGIPATDRASALAEASRRLAEAVDYGGVVDALTAVAPGVVAGCEHATVSLARRGRAATVGASDPTATAIADLQAELGEGPTIDALFGGGQVAAPDLASEVRWPTFASRLHAASPIRCALALPLLVAGRSVGVLTLYGRSAGALDGDGSLVGGWLATHAAGALARAREVEELRSGLASRDLIATAKGILMARQELSEAAAFDVLRRASQRSNVKVRDLARTIVQGTETAPEPAEGDDVDALLASLDPPLLVVTADGSDGPRGCLVGFHAQTSEDPVRLGFWLRRDSRTLAAAEQAGHVAVHHLDRRHAELALDFAGRSVDPFTRFPSLVGPHGEPVLAQVPHRALGRCHRVLDDGGTHLCLVVELDSATAGGPLQVLRRSQLAESPTPEPSP